MEATAITEQELQSRRNLPEASDPRVAKIVQSAEDGKTWSEIADELGISQRQLWTIRHENEIDAILAQRAVEVLEATQRERIAGARESGKILRQWLKSDDFERQRFAIERLFPKAGNGQGEAPLTVPHSARKSSRELSGAELKQAAREALERRKLGK